MIPLAIQALENLVKSGQLKAEPRNAQEAEDLLAMARTRLGDARSAGVSREGRFTSAYNAAHSAALAALRWHGYRSENRFLVFQCLLHTMGWPAERWRVLDTAHNARNFAEYRGKLNIEESTVQELIGLTAVLIDDVAKLVQSARK